MSISSASTSLYQSSYRQESLLTNELRIKYSFSSREETFLHKINRTFFDRDLICQHAAGFREEREKLGDKQRLLLRIVRLSADLEKIEIAASNAISILKETGFSFYQLNLEGIRIPNAILTYSLFDKANLKKSDLRGVDFTNSSFNGAVLDRSKVEGVNFSRSFFLPHDEVVITAAKASQGSCLASQTPSFLYIWDLKTRQYRKEKAPNISAKEISEKADRIYIARLVRMIRLSGSRFGLYPLSLLALSSDERFLFRVPGAGYLEVWQIDPLKRVATYKPHQLIGFKSLILSQDGNHLVLVSENVLDARDPERTRDTIEVWQVNKNSSISRLAPLGIKELTSSFHPIHFSADKSLLIIMDKRSREISVLSIPSLNLVRSIPYSVSSDLLKESALQFNADGRNLLIAQGNQVHAWDSETNQTVTLFSETRLLQREKPLSRSEITHLYHLPGTSLIGYSYQEDGFSFICIRDISQDSKLKARVEGSKYFFQKFLLNEKQLIKVEYKNIEIIPLDQISIQQRSPLGGGFITALFSTSSQRFILFNKEGECHICEAFTGRPLFSSKSNLNKRFNFVPPTGNFSLPPDVCFCSFSPDGQYVLNSYEDQKTEHLQITKIEDGTEWCHFEFPFSAYTVFPDSSHLVVCTTNCLELRELPSGKKRSVVEIESLFESPFSKTQVEILVSSPTFPRGYAIVAEHALSQVNRAIIWDVDWEKQASHKVAQISNINRMKLAGDNSLFFTRFDNSLFRWDPKTLKTKKISIDQPVDLFDINGGGSLLVFSSHLSTKRVLVLWDTFNQKKLDQLEVPIDGKGICMDPNGKLIAYWTSRSLFVYTIDEGKLRLSWKLPQQLDVKRLSMDGVEGLQLSDKRLLSELGVKV